MAASRQTPADALVTTHLLSDAILFRQAVAGLLQRSPGITSIQLSDDGSISFTFAGPIGNVQHCLAILVTEELIGASSGESLARRIETSVEARLQMQTDAANGAPPRSRGIYIVGLHEVTAECQRAVETACAASTGEPIWVCGKPLFDWFEKYWPEVLADEARALRESILPFCDSAADIGALSRVALSHGLASSGPIDPQFYVTLSLERAFGLFSIGDFMLPLPTESRLGLPWTSQELDALKFAVDYSRVIMGHVHRWGYLRGDVRAAAEVQKTAAAFVEQLRAGIDASKAEADEELEKTRASKQMSQARTSKYKLSPDRVRQFWRMRQSIAGPWRKLLATAIGMIEVPRAVKLFRRGTGSRILQVAEKDADRVIRSVDFVEACRGDDFLRAMPARTLLLKDSFTVRFPSDVLKVTTAPILIVGGPGSGKTSFCHWNALRDSQALAQGTSSVVPVLVPLHSITLREGVSFAEAFLSTAGTSGLINKRFSKRPGDARFRVYLDGLDEVPTEATRRRIIALAHEGSQTSTCQIIVTARDHVVAPWHDWLPRLHLAGITKRELQALARKWIGEDSSAFMSEVNNVKGLGSVLSSPLLATLTILVFRHSRKLPRNRCGLYRMFTELLAGGWNLAKGMIRPTSFDTTVKLRVLSALAWRVHERRRKEFSSQTLLNAIGEVIGNDKIRRAALRDEMLVDGIIERSPGGFQFRHFSYQEYFAAKYLAGDPFTTDISKCVKQFVLEKNEGEWWAEMIRFYVEMSDNPRAVAAWVRNIGADAMDWTLAETVIDWIRSAFPETEIV